MQKPKYSACTTRAACFVCCSKIPCSFPHMSRALSQVTYNAITLDSNVLKIIWHAAQFALSQILNLAWQAACCSAIIPGIRFSGFTISPTHTSYTSPRKRFRIANFQMFQFLAPRSPGRYTVRAYFHTKESETDHWYSLLYKHDKNDHAETTPRESSRILISRSTTLCYHVNVSMIHVEAK